MDKEMMALLGLSTENERQTTASATTPANAPSQTSSASSSPRAEAEPLSLKGLTLVSGGQTGGDSIALRVKDILEIPVVGVMPKGYKRADGRGAEIALQYGLGESTGGVSKKDKDNAACSDALVAFLSSKGRTGKGTMQTINLFVHGAYNFVPLHKPADQDYRVMGIELDEASAASAVSGSTTTSRTIRAAGVLRKPAFVVWDLVPERVEPVSHMLRSFLRAVAPANLMVAGSLEKTWQGLEATGAFLLARALLPRANPAYACLRAALQQPAGVNAVTPSATPFNSGGVYKDVLTGDTLLQVDGQIKDVRLLRGGCLVAASMPAAKVDVKKVLAQSGLLPKVFESKKALQKRLQRYVVKLRRSACDGTEMVKGLAGVMTDMPRKLFEKGCAAAMTQLLGLFEDIDWYTGVSGRGGMLVACYYLDGTEPWLVFWKHGMRFVAKASKVETDPAARATRAATEDDESIRLRFCTFHQYALFRTCWQMIVLCISSPPPRMLDFARVFPLCVCACVCRYVWVWACFCFVCFVVFTRCVFLCFVCTIHVCVRACVRACVCLCVCLCECGCCVCGYVPTTNRTCAACCRVSHTQRSGT